MPSSAGARFNRLRDVGLTFAALLLSSCSYSYDIKVTVIDGKLSFIVDPMSKRQPDCMNGITVSTNKGETAIARATTGDDVGLVEHGVFWWDTLDGCQNEYPIFYGQKLKGARVVYPDDFFDKEARGKEASHVAPKPLQLGVVYEVSMTSSGSGYGGSTYFRISKDGLLEIWPNDPTPPVLDKEGYDISGPYKSPPAAPTNVRLSSAELARLTS